MPTERTCLRCGTALSSDALEGLCPTCVGRAAFASAGADAITPEIEAEFARLKPEEVGEQIGQYKLMEQIGQGGFGTVWVADQEKPVRRRVALKIIKLGMDTKEVIARFEQERQALAMMDHPHIAKVFDAGATQFGRPYFVMELVRGIKITEYCDQANLPTTDRLALFIQVCNAVQHAHQKGIIHRDLKPSNILVTLHDGVPVPKVIDFGVAKATQQQRFTDLTIYTQFQQMIGTPLYMSPEQAEMSGLDIDTRSDIYSLGVLLYELLTGRTPFDPEELMRQGLDEIRRVIREQEPKKPSTFLSTMAFDVRTTVAQHRQVEGAKLIGLIRGDLDWIVMKALEKDRARRYETASDFGRDIQRFLEDKPVSAAAPSASYRFGKFARRNKAALGVAAGIAAILLAATGVSLWHAKIANDAKKDAIDKATTEQNARREAEAVSDLLTDVFKSPDPTRDGRTITVAETLDRAVGKLQTDILDQPERRAHFQQVLGETYQALGLARQAIPLLEQARDFSLKKHGREHPDTLAAMYSLAASYRAADRRDEALKIAGEVLELRRKILGPEHPDTLLAMGGVAASYHSAGRRDEALQVAERALEITRKVLGPQHRDTLRAMDAVASFNTDAGRREEALQMHEQILALSQKVSGPKHPDTLVAMGGLAKAYAIAGRRAEALGMQEQILELNRSIHGPEDPRTVAAMMNLSLSYSDFGRGDEAVKMSEQALELSRKIHAPEHFFTLAATRGLANVYVNAGRREEALKLQEPLLALSRRVNGLEHPSTLEVMGDLVIFYSDAGRGKEALQMQEQLLEISRKTNGPEHPDTLLAITNLAVCYSHAGRRDEALALREQVLALSRKVSGLENPDTLRAMNNLADSYASAGRVEEAIKLQEQVLELQSKGSGPEHRETLVAMLYLANYNVQAGRRAEGLKMHEQVLELSRKVNGPEDPDTIRAMDSVAISYFFAERLGEAIKVQETALELRLKVNGPEHPNTLAAMSNLAEFYTNAGRRDEAIKMRERVLELRRKVHGPQHPDYLRLLVDHYSDLGRWSEMIVPLKELSALIPDDTSLTLRVATLQAWLGQTADHAVTARRLLEKAAGTTDAVTAEHAARAYCLRPSADPALLQQALALARQAVELGKDREALPSFRLTLGMAEYRRGDPAAAERELTAAEQTAAGDRFVQGLARTFQAMNLFRQGRKAEALKRLAEAETQMDPLPDEASPEKLGTTQDRMIVWWLVFKEARALIQSTPNR